MARIDDLTKYVSLRVDEYLQTQADSQATDIPFGDIGFELDEAAKYLLRTIPKDLTYFVIKSPATTPNLIVDSTTNRVTIALPVDYLRFGSVKINGWSHRVSHYFSDDSPQYKNQQFAYLQGTNERPIAFLVGNPLSPVKRDLEVYPAANGTLDHLYYIPVLPAAEMPTDFDDALVWKAVSSIFLIMRYQNLSTQALQQMEIALSKIQTGSVNG